MILDKQNLHTFSNPNQQKLGCPSSANIRDNNYCHMGVRASPCLLIKHLLVAAKTVVITCYCNSCLAYAASSCIQLLYNEKLLMSQALDKMLKDVVMAVMELHKLRTYTGVWMAVCMQQMYPLHPSCCKT